MTARTLILATSTTPAGAKAEIAHGSLPRIDYLDLQQRLDADLIDFSTYKQVPGRWLDPLDRRMRLNWGQAIDAIRHWRNYDTVYSFSEDVGIPMAMLLRLAGKRPRHIVIVHNILSPRKIPIVRTLRVMSQFSLIVALASEAVDAIASAYHIPQNRLRTITNDIDEHFWRPQVNALVDPQLILSVGKAKRDYATLFGAASGLSARLHVQASSQWLLPVNHTTRPNIPQNVTVGAYLSAPQLRDLYAQAVFCVTSLAIGAHHSAGTSVIREAAAMGKAIIVAADSDMKDFLLPEETGLAVPAGDESALRRAMDNLLANPTRAEAMGRRARTWLEQTASYDQRIEQFAQLATGI